MPKKPPFEPPPPDLEDRRDKVLERLGILREKATQINEEVVLAILPALEHFAQRMRTGVESAHLEMALDHLERMVGLTP